MEISYLSSTTLFYQFSLASRHFQTALTSGSSEKIQDLWDRGVIRYAESDSISLFGRARHLFYGTLECLPVVGLIIAFIDRFLNGYVSLPPGCVAKEAIRATPTFGGYTFKDSPSVHLSDIDVRPANLLYEAIFGTDPTTQPGTGELFAFPSAAKARSCIMGLPDKVLIAFDAKDRKTTLYRRGADHSLTRVGQRDLTSFLGDQTFQISGKELKGVLDSQKIYVSGLIPKDFYLGLKAALNHDGIVILPGNDHHVPTLGEILKRDYPTPSLWERFNGIAPSDKNHNLYNVKAFLQKVQADPLSYGIKGYVGSLSFEDLKHLTLYQVGAMIVKTEDYYPLVGEGYRLRARAAGDKDAIRLISASGIRGFFNTHRINGNQNHEIDRKIMTETFRIALRSIDKDGIAIFPAVGMGVWGGDPDVYWRAFFDAVLQGGTDLKQIFVNPGHQTTRSGKYSGYRGEEFAKILDEYLLNHPDDKNLKKVVNLFNDKSDLFLLAQSIKKEQPDLCVALFNASDPDVTLGNHVGEYVTNLCHPSTTEENYAAAGTSGLGFEQMTGVLHNPDQRVLQV